MKIIYRFCAVILFLFSENVFAQTNYVTDSLKPRGNQITLDATGLANGFIGLGYETSRRQNFSWNFRMALIQSGSERNRNKEVGVFLKFGPRFYFVSEKNPERKNPYFHFRGTYFNPVIAYSHVLQSRGGEVQSEALMLNLGHQFVLYKKWSLNFFGGIGYGVEQSLNSRGSSENFFSHLLFEPLAFDFGIEAGRIFRSSPVPPREFQE